MAIQDLYKVFLESTGVCTDSRAVKKGSIFFALKGANFDGNQYAADALNMGAIMAVVDDGSIGNTDRIIVVDDVLHCLQSLATYHRHTFKGTVIALTGSNGKTTSKELITNVLKEAYQVTATRGNLNNHIGVPLTLLKADPKDNFVIVEMGANHQKEIEALCEIAHPDIGLITNIGKAHLEGFGGIEGVKKGKKEMYDYLRRHGKPIVVNKDDDVLMNLLGYYSHSITYSKDHFIQMPCQDFIKLEYKGYIINTNLIGDFQLNNIALAIRLGELYNVSRQSILRSIESYVPDNNRSERIVKEGVTHILDAYNANPTSMELSIKAFEKLDIQDKGFVIGDMLELGGYAKSEHLKIVSLFRAKQSNNIIFIGAVFSEILDSDIYQVFQSTAEAKPAFKVLQNTVQAILLKGSRGLKLEDLLND